jgi:uncharacterized membrane protein YqjE
VEPAAVEHREGGSPGIIDSVKSTIATLLQILHTRVELLTTELSEEMHRVAAILLWGAVALFSGGLFVLMVAITVIIAAGEEHRLLASLCMTGVFLALMLIAIGVLRSRVSQRTRLLASSLEELKRDRDSLKRAAHHAGDA